MTVFRLAWRGSDLYDSIEEDGMTLGARACYRIACEIVSAVRASVDGYVPEPLQEDSWAFFEFPNLRQRVQCHVALQDENDYSVDVGCARSLLQFITARERPEILPGNVETIRNALKTNPRFEVLAEPQEEL